MLFMLLALPISLFAQINVKEYGAKGNGQVDDAPAIQKAIDDGIKSGQTVYFPIGKYRIDRPLIAANWNGQDYGFFTLKIEGESTMFDMDNRSVIIANFKDAFALGIQKGKGCVIKGLSFQGKYAAPKLTPNQFYNSDLKTYGDPSCRDSQFSPYSAIVIDPFRDDLPSDGGYPTLTSFYRGKPSKSGSTAIRLEDITINNFTIGIIFSPNGKTLNAEIITLENIRLGNGKIGIVGCQAQEKMNRAINISSWGTMHTVFAFGMYGQGQPGHWIIDGLNAAGFTNQIIYRADAGFYPIHISNVFAESIRSIGVLSGTMGSSISNSVFDFAEPRAMGANASENIFGSAIFNNCVLRYYDWSGRPVVLKGYFVMNNCKFDTPPILLESPVMNSTNLAYSGNSKLNDCLIGNRFEETNTTVTSGHTMLNRYIFNGRSVRNISNNTSYFFEGNAPLNGHILVPVSSEKTIKINQNKAIVAVTTDEARDLDSGSYIGFMQKNAIIGWGEVKDPSKGQITVDKISNSVKDGSYTLIKYIPTKMFAFYGDLDKGSNRIEHLKMEVTTFPKGDYIFNSCFETGKARIIEKKDDVLILDRPALVNEKSKFITSFEMSKK